MPRLTVLAIAFAATICILPAAAAQARPLTVTITHVECIDDCDETGLEAALEGHADFFAKLWIDGREQPRTPVHDNSGGIDPFWPVTQEVPDDAQSVPVSIQIWDVDDSSGPDNGDVSARDADSNLDFVVDMATGKWSDPAGEDDVAWPQTCSTGDGGDNDQPRVKVCFDISTSEDGDTDDDGIPDGVERFGLPDANGSLTPLTGVQMDPCRKTIALEVDWMADGAHSHRPSDDAVADAVAAMDRAPVDANAPGTPAPPCPYAGFPVKPKGVQLVIDRSNAITEQAEFPISSLAGVRDAPGNFARSRRPFMHYVLFVHDQKAGDSTSGRCCVDHRDFVVSLGSWGSDANSFRDQSATILHELGHSLTLGHGGGDERNYKPNYLSVMNYSFDPLGIPDSTIAPNIDSNDPDSAPDLSFRLDYSRDALPQLDEAALEESLGIRGGTDRTFWYDPTYTKQTGAGSGAIDWDQLPGNGPKVDLNRDYCVEGGPDALQTTRASDDTLVAGGAWIGPGPNFVCDTQATGNDVQNTPQGTNVLSKLNGYDDWENIRFRAAMSADAPGADHGHAHDITAEQAEEQEERAFALFSPDLALVKAVDRAAAAPGQRLAYTVTARNEGTGTATSVVMLDTFADGSQTSRSLGVIAAGDEAATALTYDVPCTTEDGTKIVNNAGVTARNLLDNPEADTANNSASATTTVHAPKLALSATATGSVDAGEAITYRLTYENSGSGSAQDVTITDTLPAEVYYSAGLDTGAGPAPGTVARNADGTTTLTWNVGAVDGDSGPQVIEYTARPSLLLVAGSTVANGARLTFGSAGGCTYDAVTAARSVSVTSVPPTRDPLTHGYWKSHPDTWTGELLARIQATDQRYDGADGSAPDGRLTEAEVGGAFGETGGSPQILRGQLLATYFNLATRRINAATAIRSKTATRLGLGTVRAAALYASATLALPLGGNADRYSDAVRTLDEINMNRSVVY